MVCESSPSMRRAAGRVDHWDELSINDRRGRKHSSDFARVIRELKSIPDTEKLTISQYQKMISQGIIPDILISANAVPDVNINLSYSPISQRFSPWRWAARTPQISSWPQAPLSPSNWSALYRMTNNPLPGCIAIFHKYCCYKKTWWYYNKFDSTPGLYEIIGGTGYRCVKIPQCGYID